MRRLCSSPLALALALVVVSTTVHRPAVVAQASSRERTIFVSAVDQSGTPIDGLPTNAFVVREDGVRREVLRVSKATESIDIALLIDNSAAVSDEITFIRSSVSKFVAKMAAGNQIALIALADRPTILVDYTSDPKRLADGVGRLFAMSESGMTLLDAIGETSKGLARREAPRAAIVPIITDGTEFTNRYFRDVVKDLVTARAALHAVTIGQFYHSEEHGIRERSFLLDAGPRESGGQRISLLSPHGLEPSLEKLARELSSQYKVIYNRPESLIPPEKVEVSSGREGVTMRGTPARGGIGT
jgi:VWA domain-containing protein